MAKAKNPNKKLMHTIIALVIWAIFKWLIPAPAPMTDTGMEICGVFVMATYLWITVETGWTSILTVSMVAISGAMSATNAIKSSFGDWMFAFLMACMLVNHVLSETGISRRIAVWFITRKFVKGRPYIIVLMFFAAMFVLGLGMTSSATCVMFLALAKEILDTCGFDRKDKFSQFLFCSIAAITIAGNGMTAIGHGNFITGIGWVAEAFSIEISVAQSAAIGCSIGIVWILLLVLIMAKIYKIDASKLVNLDIDALRATVPPMNKKEIFAGVMFLVVIFFWVGKDLLSGLVGIPFFKSLRTFISSLGSAIPVLLCVCVFCVVPIDGEPLMNFNKATKSIAWQSCMMIGTVRLLGTVVNQEDLGIVAWIQEVFGPMVQSLPPFIFVAVCVGAVLLLTNFVSNSIAMVLFKVAAPLIALMPGVNGPALGVLMICAAHYAMWTPGCTTTTSFVVGSGDADGGFMTKYMWLPMIAAYIAIMTVGFLVANLIF